MYKCTFSGTGHGFTLKNLDDALLLLVLDVCVIHVIESKSRK